MLCVSTINHYILYPIELPWQIPGKCRLFHKPLLHSEIGDSWMRLGSGSWNRGPARRLGLQGHVDVFKDFTWRDPQEPFGRLNQVISRRAPMLPAERVSEGERLGELLSADQKASAIDIPIFRHKTSTPNFRLSASRALRAADFQSQEERRPSQLE